MKDDKIMSILIRDYTNLTVEVSKTLLKENGRTQKGWSEVDYKKLMEIIRVLRMVEDEMLNREKFLNMLGEYLR